MRPAALLFDLDGTLVDSHLEISMALERAMVDVGLHEGLSRAMELVDGSPLPKIWQTLRPEDAAGYEAFALSYRTHYARDLGKHCALFPGVEDTLERLRSRLPGVQFGVVSNKAASSVAPLLEHAGIASFFAVALGSGGTSMRAKPHPESLWAGARALGSQPHECVMVGDTVFDVQAGNAAGMRTVALTYGMSSVDALRASQPDHLIEAFETLLTLFP